jgi:hypothetical protein
MNFYLFSGASTLCIAGSLHKHAQLSPPPPHPLAPGPARRKPRAANKNRQRPTARSPFSKEEARARVDNQPQTPGAPYVCVCVWLGVHPQAYPLSPPQLCTPTVMLKPMLRRKPRPRRRRRGPAAPRYAAHIKAHGHTRKGRWRCVRLELDGLPHLLRLLGRSRRAHTQPTNDQPRPGARSAEGSKGLTAAKPTQHSTHLVLLELGHGLLDLAVRVVALQQQVAKALLQHTHTHHRHNEYKHNTTQGMSTLWAESRCLPPLGSARLGSPWRRPRPPA